MAVKTLDDLLAEGVSGRGVLVRSDLNVPLDDDRNITDPGRIIASVPTLNALSDAGAKVVVTAHLGRPKDGPDPKFSLAPVAKALGEQLGRHVQLAGDVVGSDALARAEGLTDGDILLLENIRFDPRETSKDDDERLALAKQLVELVGDDGAFVSDGFGVVHRKQASVYDVATLLPHYAGTLVAAEIKVLEQLTSSTDRPYAVVLGGSKVSDKLAVIESLAEKADSLVIGGGMCFTFLASQGVSVGTSLLEESMIDTCRKLLETYGDVIHVPVDIVVADEVRRRFAVGDRRGRPDPRGQDGPGHRARLGGAVHRAAVQRQDHLLERPDGRVRVPGVRRGHQGCRRGDHRRDRQGRVQRRRRRRLGGGRAPAGPARRRLLPHFHRRRGVAGIP